MNPANLHLRRATVDDLVALRKLWKQFGFDGADLEKRLTEFQIIETPEGTMLGALGFRLSGKQGLIHSEAFTQPELERELRARMWERLQSLSRNHGLVRLWTTEAAPFWQQSGFAEAGVDALERLPAVFGNQQSRWQTAQLREEAPAISLDKEFELFKQANQESTERVLRQARALRLIAGVLAFIFFIFVVAGIVYLMRQKSSPNKTQYDR